MQNITKGLDITIKLQAKQEFNIEKQVIKKLNTL